MGKNWSINVLILEQDYEYTSYIAELFNTITNVTYGNYDSIMSRRFLVNLVDQVSYFPPYAAIH